MSSGQQKEIKRGMTTKKCEWNRLEKECCAVEACFGTEGVHRQTVTFRDINLNKQ